MTAGGAPIGRIVMEVSVSFFTFARFSGDAGRRLYGLQGNTLPTMVFLYPVSTVDGYIIGRHRFLN